MAHLKQQNRTQIVLYAAAHFAGFSWVLDGGAFPQDWEGRIAAITTSAVASGLITLAQIIYSGFLGDKFKAVLVFWRLKHPLPGCRAFSTIAPRDPRIDAGRLKVRLGELPADPDEQNRVWYRLYRQHKDEASVNDAHGNYLLARELACLSIAFLFALPTLALALGVSFKVALPYAEILLVIYVLVAYSGSYYGHRFVANVLAIESALPEITHES